MRIRYRMLLVMIGVLMFISIGFTWVFYRMWHQSLEAGIDRELLTAAVMAKDVLPVNYHERISGKDSVSDAEYLQIVDRFNEICKRTGMEYLWSLMILDGEIVFTSGTSPGKDASQRDQAAFLEVHSNPGAYTQVFETMQPKFEVIEDKWGRIRAVLVPFYDAQGRKFLVGASRRMQEVDARLQHLLSSCLLLSGGTLVLGTLISIILSHSLARPITQLNQAASKIAAGDYTHQLALSTSISSYNEVASLANSFERMRQAIQAREETLRKNKEQYRILTENVKDVAWILDVETRRFRYVSPAVERQRGYTPEEILAEPVTHALTPQASEYLVKLMDSRAESMLAGQEPLGKFYTEEVEQLCKDGSTIWTEVISSYSINPASGRVEMHGVTRDISERRAAEEALKESHAKLELLFDLLPVGISVLDRERKIVKTNPALERILSISIEGLVQGKYNERKYFRPDGTRMPHEEYASTRVLNGETQALHVETGVEKEDGAIVWVDVSAIASPFADWSTIIVIADISERKQAADEVRTAQAELQSLLAETERSRQALLSLIEDQKEAEEKILQLNRELEQHVRERTAQLTTAVDELEAFSYSVSHDLRAPLRALDGFSAILLDEHYDHLDEQGQHYLKRIQEASQRMGQLINDLLNLSRVTRAEFTPQRVNLSALAQTIAAELKAQAPQRQVKFAITAGMIVEGDANLIKIALENLLHNAFKFTGQCDQAVIQVGMLEQSGERIYFVRDNGAGFNMEYASKLFTPFQRLHGANEFPGTGIGLSIVYRIISRHGGRIWPESEEYKGTTFYFTLGGRR